MKDSKQEFIELAKISGWSQAEIARKLDMTRGGVNGIITGDRKPGPRLVELFRIKLAAERPDLLTDGKYPAAKTESIAGMDPSEIDAALNDLRRIHRNDPEAFKTVHQVITTYAKTASEKRRASKERVKTAVKYLIGEAVKEVRAQAGAQNNQLPEPREAAPPRSAPQSKGEKARRPSTRPK